MRIKMSDGYRGTARQATDVLARINGYTWPLELDAEREAWAILAETEPDQSFIDPGDDCSHFANIYTAHLEACLLCTDAEHGWPAQYKREAEYAAVALAEALATFMGGGN